jgi:hypothetical protein
MEYPECVNVGEANPDIAGIGVCCISPAVLRSLALALFQHNG